MKGMAQSGVAKLAVVLLCTGLSGCFGAKKKPLLPVPPPPAPVARPEPLPTPEVPTPEVRTPEVPAPNVKSVPPTVRMPPAARPARPKPVPTAPAAPEAPKPAPPSPQPPLGAILSASTEHQFRTELDQLMVRARAVVERSNGQTLTGVQRETVERIRSFLEQANAAREKDPATALQLARRADLLGQDLVKSLPRD